MLEYAAKHGIVIQAYSSLMFAPLPSFYISDLNLSHFCSPITKYPGGPVDAPINAAAKRLGATPTQVIMSWVRSKGVAIVT
jgi:diketogulonate reductase-like aldo/keto reductase